MLWEHEVAGSSPAAPTTSLDEAGQTSASARLAIETTKNSSVRDGLCAGPEDLRQAGERIRRAVAETSVDEGELRVRVTVSVGGSTYGDGADSPEALVAQADAALYAAKEAGRNRLVLT